MLESQFQSKLIKELKKLFPGCIVMKSDSGYLQGIPDLLILFNDKWAALECSLVWLMIALSISAWSTLREAGFRRTSTRICTNTYISLMRN